MCVWVCVFVDAMVFSLILHKNNTHFDCIIFGRNT